MELRGCKCRSGHTLSTLMNSNSINTFNVSSMQVASKIVMLWQCVLAPLDPFAVTFDIRGRDLCP